MYVHDCTPALQSNFLAHALLQRVCAKHRQRLVGVRKALDLAAVRAAMPLDGAAVPGLAEDCSAIADELEAEAEELRQVADAVEESEMEASDEKARVTPDSV